MASLYKRPNSSFWWIKWKDGGGKIRRESTGYRIDSPLENRKAESLRADRTLEEAQRRKRGSNKGLFDTWVVAYIKGRYPNDRSQKRFRAAWKTVHHFLTSKGVSSPTEVRRDHCFEYRDWRRTGKDRPTNWRKKGAGDPTINFELKLLSLLMDEAVERGYAVRNPCTKLRISRKRAKERPEITVASGKRGGLFGRVACRG